jgi:hypothetical protein
VLAEVEHDPPPFVVAEAAGDVDLDERLVQPRRRRGFDLFPSSWQKGRLTEAVGRYYVEFETAAGWEFVLNGEPRPAGFSGVAQVKRCHLSQTPHPGEQGWGRLLGASRMDYDAIGFDVGCDYFPHARVEDDCLHFDDAGLPSTIAVRVPYAFIRRAYPLPSNEQDPIRPVTRPTHDEVFQIAREAVEQLVSMATAPSSRS